MAIGLNADQLSTIFNETYRDWSKKLEDVRMKMADDYLKMGIPEKDANIQSMLQIRWEASARAMIATFLANNAQIEADWTARSKT